MFLMAFFSFVIIILGDLMKILKFSKLKSNRYNVTLEDGEVLKLYDDVIVKYSLIRYKEIKDEELDDLIKYNESLDAYYGALRYLTVKLRSEIELKKYLSRKYETDVIKETIDRLKKDGYLNRNIYIKCFINDSLSLSNIGPNKIRKELNKLGFFEDEYNQYIEDIEDGVWLDKLDRIISKRINTNHRYSNNKLKEKILYDLSNEGYYKWMIEEIIKSKDFKENDMLVQKEYDKLFRKLSRKYDGSELSYQIKQRLYVKGFNSNEIEKVFLKN
jgi:regulatory protein